MPTVLIVDGYKIRIYTDDHVPAHVYVFKAEGEIKIHLGSDVAGQKRAPLVVRVRNASARETKRALEIVIENQAVLLEKWREFYG